jgi:hypothetical protein
MEAGTAVGESDRGYRWVVIKVAGIVVKVASIITRISGIIIKVTGVTVKIREALRKGQERGCIGGTVGNIWGFYRTVAYVWRRLVATINSLCVC